MVMALWSSKGQTKGQQQFCPASFETFPASQKTNIKCLYACNLLKISELEKLGVCFLGLLGCHPEQLSVLIAVISIRAAINATVVLSLLIRLHVLWFFLDFR